MNFVWLISTVLLIVSFLIIKKKDEKQNFVEWLIIAGVAYACFNGVLSVIYTAVGLEINLLTLTFPNFIAGGVLLFFAIKKNKFQSYTMGLKDFIATGVVLAACVYLFLYNFGGPAFNIAYPFTGDASVHYTLAKQFYQNSQLSIRSYTLKGIGGDSAGPMLAYINTGIIFQFFGGILNSFYFYKLYIIFDVVLFFLSGMAFYYAIKKFLNKTGFFVIAIFAVVYYMCGYPLNMVVYGFPELLLAVIIIGCIIILGQKYFNSELSKRWFYPLLGLFITGVFYAYHLLIPILLLGLAVSFFIYGFDFKKFRLTIKVQELIVMVITFIIPVAFGLIYLFVLPSKNGVVDTTYTLKLEGPIYRDLFPIS